MLLLPFQTIEIAQDHTKFDHIHTSNIHATLNGE